MHTHLHDPPFSAKDFYIDPVAGVIDLGKKRIRKPVSPQRPQGTAPTPPPKTWWVSFYIVV